MARVAIVTGGTRGIGEAISLALRDLGQPGQALESYRRALEIRPDAVNALNNLGNIQCDLGHYDEALPGAVHRVIYERLVDDFEPEVRRLLDYLGLPFDPACLDFHSTRRPVATASAEQVRRPLNRDGIGAWRAYAEWLGPLEDAVGDLERTYAG